MVCKKILLGLVLLNAFLVNAQTLNKLDADGKKDGLWKGTYEESKRARYEGTFSHGKETGVFKFFDDTKKGDVVATRDFTANDGSSFTIFYDQNKNKVSEGKEVGKASSDGMKTARRKQWQNIGIAIGAVAVAVTALVLVSSNAGHSPSHSVPNE